jgi:hypothetical protein
MAIADDWAPEACTLPTAGRPMRVKEFDDLFASVLRTYRAQPTRLDLVMPADIGAAASDLARRESQCCSFFTFEFDSAGGETVMRIGVPPEQVGVLDAIETRVENR